jgi:HEAT repeat protein
LRLPEAGANQVLAAGVVLLFAGFAALWFAGSKERAALAEFRATGRDDTAAMARGIASPFPSVRHEAAYRYSRTKAGFEPGPLLKALDDPDFRVRLWAAFAAGKTGKDEVRLPLIKALDDPEIFVRYRAAEGLEALEGGRGSRANPEVIEALLRMIRTRRWYEAMYAYKALRRIDPQKW